MKTRKSRDEVLLKIFIGESSRPAVGGGSLGCPCVRLSVHGLPASCAFVVLRSVAGVFLSVLLAGGGLSVDSQ